MISSFEKLSESVGNLLKLVFPLSTGVAFCPWMQKTDCRSDVKLLRNEKGFVDFQQLALIC